MRKISILFSLFTALLLLGACTKDHTPQELKQHGVIVLNQGNFTEQNGSISYYNEETGVCQNLAFEAANGGVSLGAIIMSGYVDEQNIAYLLCSNPDKMVRIDAKTTKVAGPAITQGLANPRNILVYGGSIYVTNSGFESIDLGNWFYEYINSYVAVYNQSTGAYIKNIPVGSDAEGLCVAGGKLFVAVKEGVKVIDLALGSVTATIRSTTFTGAAKYVVADYQGRVWASYPYEGVMELNAGYTAQARTIPVDLDYEAFITLNKERDKILTFRTLYDENWAPKASDIFAVDLRAGTAASIFSGHQLYSVGANPASGKIYTAETSFTSNCVLSILQPNGQRITTATAGIGTARYLFFEE